MKITSVSLELCECGRLYKDRKDDMGKMICSACYNNCSVEDLNRLWSTPIQRNECSNQNFGD